MPDAELIAELEAEATKVRETANAAMPGLLPHLDALADLLSSAATRLRALVEEKAEAIARAETAERALKQSQECSRCHGTGCAHCGLTGAARKVELFPDEQIIGSLTLLNLQHAAALHSPPPPHDAGRVVPETVGDDWTRRHGFPDVSADELAFRKELWLRHACAGHFRYGDDGEMQCTGPCNVVDYRRRPVPEIVQALFESDLIRASAALAAGRGDDSDSDVVRLRAALEDCIDSLEYVQRNGSYTGGGVRADRIANARAALAVPALSAAGRGGVEAVPKNIGVCICGHEKGQHKSARFGELAYCKVRINSTADGFCRCLEYNQWGRLVARSD